MVPKKEGVYILFSGNDVVYVGQSNDILRRLREHIKDGTKKFDSFAAIETTDRKSVEALLMGGKENKAPGSFHGHWVGDTWTSKFRSMKECVETYKKEYPRIPVSEIADQLGIDKRVLLFALAEHENEVPAWLTDDGFGHGWQVDREWYEENRETVKEWINEWMDKRLLQEYEWMKKRLEQKKDTGGIRWTE